jgi:hypothetical protein
VYKLAEAKCNTQCASFLSAEIFLLIGWQYCRLAAIAAECTLLCLPSQPRKSIKSEIVSAASAGIFFGKYRKTYDSYSASLLFHTVFFKLD